MYYQLYMHIYTCHFKMDSSFDMSWTPKVQRLVSGSMASRFCLVTRNTATIARPNFWLIQIDAFAHLNKTQLLVSAFLWHNSELNVHLLYMAYNKCYMLRVIGDIMG